MIGVSARQVVHYESGGQAPSPMHLRRLAEALRCPAGELVGVSAGTETLEDLRYAAGLTLEQVVHAASALGEVDDLSFTRYALARTEGGRQPTAWSDPVAGGRVVAALSRLYSQPVRVVFDAWMRTLPESPAPSAGSVPTSSQAGHPARDRQRWENLNARQRRYLTVMFEADQDAEQHAASVRAGYGDPGPAAAWRRLEFSIKAPLGMAEYTDLQRRLQHAGEHDPGAGATLAALQRRGLVSVTEDEVELPGLGRVARVLVELTRVGRACARAGLDRAPARRGTAPLLSEWLWKNLVRVAAAEPEGLPDSALGGKSRFYLAVGYRSPGRTSRGFIDSVPVQAGSGEQSWVQEYRWHLTDVGRRHIGASLGTYQSLYPSVDVSGLN